MYRRPSSVSRSVYEVDHGSANYELAQGAPVVAVRDGVVTAAKRTSLGNHIVIKHDDTWSTFYQHLERSDVKKGDHVVQGQQLGIAGHGDIGDIRHLHFELRKNGSQIDPEHLMEEEWIVIDRPTVGGRVAFAKVKSHSMALGIGLGLGLGVVLLLRRPA
jgi:hypothetical protein